MKKLALFLALLGLTTASHAAKLEQQIDVENKIKKRLTERIDPLLGTDSYKILVTTKVHQTRNKVLLQGEETKKNEGNPAIKMPDQILPGFFKSKELTDAATGQVKSDSKQKYKFQYSYVIDHAHVDFLVDNTLDSSVVDIVQKLVRDDLQATFNTAFSLNVLPVPLSAIQTGPKFDLAGWWQGYLTSNGGRHLEWITLGLILLLFGFGLLAIYRIFLRIRNTNQMIPVEAAQASNDGGEESGQISATYYAKGKRVIARLVSEITQNPLCVRRFLNELCVRDQLALIKAVPSKALRQYLIDFGGLKADPDSQETPLIETLQHIENDLIQYLKLQSTRVKQPFGYLAFMDAANVMAALESEGDLVGSLVAVARYLSPDQFRRVCDALNQDQQTEVLSRLHAAGSDVTPSAELDVALRQWWERQNRQGLTASREVAAIEMSFLENLDSVDQIIKRLQQKEGQLPPYYKKFTVGFDDLLQLGDDMVARVLERLSNETIADAFQGQEIHASVWKNLGEMRGKIIKSLHNRRRQLGTSSGERQEARREFLKIYRNFA